jgi:uncharacterized protein
MVAIATLYFIRNTVLIMNIGLISDTHGYIYPGIMEFFKDCQQIWHCGDIGTFEVIDQLETIAPVKAVHGNIDYGEIKRIYPEQLVFETAGLKTAMQHIGGYPGNYNTSTRQLLISERPHLLVCGHSHILKIMYDKTHECLFMNPGAAGNYGFHTFITAIRFKIEKGRIVSPEVFEAKRG